MEVAIFLLGWALAAAAQQFRVEHYRRQSADLRAQVAEMWAQMARAGVEYRPWQ